MLAEYSKEESAEKQRKMSRFDRDGTAAHCRTIAPGEQSGSRPRRSTCSRAGSRFTGCEAPGGLLDRSLRTPADRRGRVRSRRLGQRILVISSRALNFPEQLESIA